MKKIDLKNGALNINGDKCNRPISIVLNLVDDIDGTDLYFETSREEIVMEHELVDEDKNGVTIDPVNYISFKDNSSERFIPCIHLYVNENSVEKIDISGIYQVFIHGQNSLKPINISDGFINIDNSYLPSLRINNWKEKRSLPVKVEFSTIDGISFVESMVNVSSSEVNYIESDHGSNTRDFYSCDSTIGKIKVKDMRKFIVAGVIVNDVLEMDCDNVESYIDIHRCVLPISCEEKVREVTSPRGDCLFTDDSAKTDVKVDNERKTLCKKLKDIFNKK